MPSYFFDSSALVKRYVQEIGTPRVLALIHSGQRLVVARLAIVELTAILVRRARDRGLSTQDVELVLDAFDFELRELFEVVELSGGVMGRAVDLVRLHALRAADGVQLACALTARGSFTEPNELVFVCADAELNTAAEAEDFELLDPNLS